MDYFDVRFRMGVTATPRRLDGKGLADWFGPEPLYVYSIRQAIKDNVLVPLRSFKIETGVNLDAVATRGGDFAEGELADAVNTPQRNAAVVAAYLEHASDRRAIVFAVDLAHVRDLAQAFQDAGVGAASVTGKDNIDVRRQTLADFAAGKYAVLVNCQVATEGFDDQGVDCILMARPTQSQALYTQCVGRGLRRCDATGKVDCLILDITDNCRRHKLMTATSLLGEEQDAQPIEGYQAEEADEDDAQAQLARKNQPLVWRLAEVSPWPELPNLEGYAPSKVWHHDTASEGQLKYLRSFGLDVSRALTKGEASYLIDRAAKLDAEFPTPATPKQARCLRYMGHWRDGLTKREATRLIGELKAGTACRS
jgi:superfamily II DNA or RNA helicase